MASIGSAVGLGNMWKFPYLCYKWGGAVFFIPYGICLLFLGIPMIMLEFSLGQILQRGNFVVWQKLQPCLQGIGLATTLSCYLIAIFYNVIIAYTVVLGFSALYNPLPWSIQRTTNAAQTSKDCVDEGIYISEE